MCNGLNCDNFTEFLLSAIKILQWKWQSFLKLACHCTINVFFFTVSYESLLTLCLAITHKFVYEKQRISSSNLNKRTLVKLLINACNYPHLTHNLHVYYKHFTHILCACKCIVLLHFSYSKITSVQFAKLISIINSLLLLWYKK